MRAATESTMNERQIAPRKDVEDAAGRRPVAAMS